MEEQSPRAQTGLTVEGLRRLAHSFGDAPGPSMRCIPRAKRGPPGDPAPERPSGGSGVTWKDGGSSGSALEAESSQVVTCGWEGVFPSGQCSCFRPQKPVKYSRAPPHTHTHLSPTTRTAGTWSPCTSFLLSLVWGQIWMQQQVGMCPTARPPENLPRACACASTQEWLLQAQLSRLKPPRLASLPVHTAWN